MKRDSKNPEKQYALGGSLAGKGAERVPEETDRPFDDEEMLPVLEEVIQPGDPVSGNWEEAEGAQSVPSSKERRSSLPGADFELDILAYRLRTHFSEGLEQIVQAAVSTAVEHSVRDLEKTLQHELIESLESRLDQMVSSFLDDQSPGSRFNGRDEDTD